jgi:hypothetical protein
MGHFFHDPKVDSRFYEAAAHAVYAAPGYAVFLEGHTDGKRQLVAIDPDHVDEVCRRLHQAKRYANTPASSTRNQP